MKFESCGHYFNGESGVQEITLQIPDILYNINSNFN